jgi:glycosyltransferase involved in cell wall biosynthesis
LRLYLRQYSTLRGLVHGMFRLIAPIRVLLLIIGNTGSVLIAIAAMRLARPPRRAPPGSREIVMLAVSDLRIDPRIEREVRALAAAGHPLKLLFPDISLPPIAQQPLDWGPGVSFHPLAREAASYMGDFPWLFGRGFYRAAREERPFAFHCHDLTTAAIGLAAAHRTGARCICDFHEWFSENVSWNKKRQGWAPHGSVRRRLFRSIERLAIEEADGVVTVCDSIAAELQDMTPKPRRPVIVVRNIPEFRLTPSRTYRAIKQELGVDADRFLLLWQGGTGPTRLIEPIIRALSLAPRAVFVIRGPSLDLFGEGYRALARQCGVLDRLILLPPVPSRDVVAAARGADAGIWSLPKLCRNFYYALPNKVFEYLASGLPVLGANFPEVRRLIEENGVGLCFEPTDPAAIARQLNRLIDEPQLAVAMRAAIPRLLTALDAGHEWQKLVTLYHGLAGDQRPAEAA